LFTLLSTNVIFCQDFAWIIIYYETERRRKVVFGKQEDIALWREVNLFTGIIYPMSVRRLLVFLIGICLFPILFSACNKSSPVSTSTPMVLEASQTPVTLPEPSSTPIPPTATPVPLAAMVNGEGITLAEFQAELARFEVASAITGTNIASNTNTIVINDLIDQTLLTQAAAEKGYIVDDALLQSRIDALTNQLGGNKALEDWKAAHGYSDEDFRIALKRSVGAAWMRDQIVAAVPETADEVHVMQILVPTKAEADQVYASLQSGKDFLEVASTYDPMTKGDLGWFPRGYLSDPAIEDAAFGLQAGQYSGVIQTEVGFHILYLVERDPEHTLQPDALRVLQGKAIQDWISERRKQSAIQILLP
jgi:peptidyl-prolyl cis-trans isomerase C